MENCPLCTAIKEEYRVIKKTKFSYAIINKWPIKKGHIMVLPKRHVTQNKFSNLTPEEAKDFISLLEEMQERLNSKYEDDILIIKNSKSHSSQPHLHFHVVPSQYAMRELIGKTENIPISQDWSKEEYMQVRDYINSEKTLSTADL
ncbi:MAG: diadenosine tetraphosphate (Ap4A) HIT family hydrolase [Patescibacteria group bacterium]|jgi:diadenosine tetraphosphate (Ap4A) HIT family hydrolase